MSKEIEETRAAREKQRAFQKEMGELAESLRARGFTFAFSIYNPDGSFFCTRWTGHGGILAEIMGHLTKNVVASFAVAAGALQKQVKMDKGEADETWAN